MSRAIILVLDSFGIGASADANRFGDAGADTLGQIARYCADAAEGGRREGPLHLPNLAQLGLWHAARDSTGTFPAACTLPDQVTGAYGYAAELSTGKDTPSGHWEITGVPVLSDWGYFPDKEHSFPAKLLSALVDRGGLPGILGNCHASGTTIIAELGEEHLRTGKPIVYTSADSVLQIACHEQSFGLDRLLGLCVLARKLVDEYNIGRVIARPFTGDDAATFRRTANRRDYAVPPPAPTLLDRLVAAGGEVVGIGKIPDIFAHRGISRKVKADGNMALMDATLAALADTGSRSIVFTNFVDFDMVYGHRRDIAGYATALEQFDARLPELMARLQDDDIMVCCADHGCDPSFPGSDHTREHIPVLAFGPTVPAGPIGFRNSFADIGQTLAGWLGLEPLHYGRSFLLPHTLPQLG